MRYFLTGIQFASLLEADKRCSGHSGKFAKMKNVKDEARAFGPSSRDHRPKLWTRNARLFEILSTSVYTSFWSSHGKIKEEKMCVCKDIVGQKNE